MTQTDLTFPANAAYQRLENENRALRDDLQGLMTEIRAVMARRETRDRPVMPAGRAGSPVYPDPDLYEATPRPETPPMRPDADRPAIAAEPSLPGREPSPPIPAEPTPRSPDARHLPIAQEDHIAFYVDPDDPRAQLAAQQAGLENRYYKGGTSQWTSDVRMVDGEVYAGFYSTNDADVARKAESLFAQVDPVSREVLSEPTNLRNRASPDAGTTPTHAAQRDVGSRAAETEERYFIPAMAFLDTAFKQYTPVILDRSRLEKARNASSFQMGTHNDPDEPFVNFENRALAFKYDQNAASREQIKDRWMATYTPSIEDRRPSIRYAVARIDSYDAMIAGLTPEIVPPVESLPAALGRYIHPVKGTPWNAPHHFCFATRNPEVAREAGKRWPVMDLETGWIAPIETQREQSRGSRDTHDRADATRPRSPAR